MAKRIFAVLLALLTLLSLTGCKEEEEPVLQRETTEATTEATEAPTTEPPTEPPTTEAPTEAPTEPPLVLHSGLREDGSFNENTLFIGDSLTFQMLYGYMRPRGSLGEAKYIAICGSRTTAFFDGTQVKCRAENTLASEEFNGLLFSEAVASLEEGAEAIYIMWGTNFNRDGSAQDYIEIVDYILENCPNATVHLQTVPHAHAAPYEIINGRIREAWEHYQEEGEQRVQLLDTYTGIGVHVASDGIHLTDGGKAEWYKTLVANAENLEE